MAEPISVQQLKDASLDVKSLEEVVNGDENVVVTTRLGETYPSVKGSIKTLFEYGGLPAEPFETKAQMEIDGAALIDGDYAYVTDDNDTTNNGLYVKTAGIWVKSAYDPLTQAKTYVDANPLFNPAQISAGGDLNLLDVGIYYNYPADAQDILNMPPLTSSVKGGLLEVIRKASLVYQKYYHYVSLEQWERVGDGASSNLQYGAWTKVIKQSDLENSESNAVSEAVNQSTTYTDGITYQDKGRLTTEHLDTLLSRGIWVSNITANASLANGYPWDAVPCVITNYKTSSTPTILQTAQSIEATRKRTASRRWNGTSWGQWNIGEAVQFAQLDADVKNKVAPKGTWLYPDDAVCTFDKATRILSWDKTITLATRNVTQNRVNFSKGSIDLSTAPDFTIIYLDLTLLPTDGSTVTNPNNCIKFGTYNQFVDDITKLPIAVMRSATGNVVSKSGFMPIINGSGGGTSSSDGSSTIEFNKTATALEFYVKGGGANMIKHQLVHAVMPDIQLDNWGMTTAMEVDSEKNNVKAITSNGVWECALKDSANASDHSGGSHGDELKTSAFFLVDGVYKAEDFVLSGKAKEIKFVQKSVIYAQESQVKIADRQVEWTFSFDKLNIKQTVTPVAGRTFSSTWILMLPVLRKSNTDNTGTQITDKEVRNTDFTVVDVSEPDFERREQVANDGDFINLSGQVSGISATVKVNHINSPNPMHFVQNNIQFNKIYLAARTINTSALIAEGETWTVDADIIIKTIN